jgi:hypothetical protein
MSTDFFRRYLDLLNEATGQPPADFAPTHFHKNNLGFKIPLMQTPDGSFWWMTTDSENPRAGKTIQSWVGNTENRSSLSGTASVDGVFKDGKAIEFPEGMTWKEYAASAEKSPQAALPAAKSRQIEPELLAPLEPTDSGRKLVAPNTNVALPSSGTFSNDQALANLAAQMKDATSGIASTGNKIDSLESLEILRKVKALGEEANKLSDTIDPTAPNAKDEIQKDTEIVQQFTDLFQEMAKLPENSVSGTTLQQARDIYNSSIKKIQGRMKSIEDRIQQIKKDGAVASGDSSSAAAGSGSGAQWAFVPGDGTSKDISVKKDSSGVPSAAEIGAGAAGAAASKKSGKETMITDLSHCEQCGTPKSIHAPLKHQFVPGDDVRPGPVGGSQSASDTSVKPSSDTFDADVAARMAKIPAWDRAKNAPVGAPTKPRPPKPRSPGSALKEDIDRLPVADQMRAWQQLIEAPSGLTAAQAQAQRAGLGRPGAVGVGDKPDTRNLTDKLRDKDRLRFSTGPDIDRQVPKPKVPASTAGYLQAVSPNSPLGRAQTRATAAPPTPPAAPADWKAKVKSGMKRLATPAAALYSIYQGWQQISALPKDKMSRAQYAAEVTKIVARLVQENGIVLVSTTLGGLAGAPAGGVGAIPGMIAGAGAGLAAEYYFGDDISKVVNGVVDYMYGTDQTPEPQQNKPTPAEVAENKAYVEGMAVWIAAGGIPDETDKKEMDAARAILKAAGVAVAPAPQAAERVPSAADSVARYKETFDKANAIVDKIKNLDPMTNPALSSSASGAALAKALYNLISEMTSLYASEIGAEGQQDPAVAKQMESILAAARAAAEAKTAEHDAGREQPATGGPKEGQTGTVPGNPPKKVIFKNGKWVPQ